MSLRDYDHHNEDAVAVWWAEEGSQPKDEPDYDDDRVSLHDYDPWDYAEGDR